MPQVSWNFGAIIGILNHSVLLLARRRFHLEFHLDGSLL